MEIIVDHSPSKEKLQRLGVFSWPMWEKEESKFPYEYDATETCYILEGHFVVTPTGGDGVEIRAGDLVVFPVGLSCHWKILKKVRKHYQFS
jgi:uncharacterized protein